MERSEGNMSLEKNPVTPPGIDPATIRLVAQRLNLYSTQAPELPVTTDNYLCYRMFTAAVTLLKYWHMLLKRQDYGHCLLGCDTLLKQQAMVKQSLHRPGQALKVPGG
jgi:hypothetical protein